MVTVGTKNASTREAWIEKALSRIPAGSRLLDAGAGEQQFKKYCKHLNYVSQDFAQYKPEEEVKQGLQMPKWDYGKLDIISDIVSIPEPDKSFDGILCTEVIEHIPDPVLALKEFSRLLKPNGYLILTAPFCSMTHFAPYHYSTGFNKYYYEHHFGEMGFEIVNMEYNGNYFEYLAQELRRLPSISDVYVANKPNFLQRLLLKVKIRLILYNLSSFSKNNKNSEELLSYGIHVVAKRVSGK